MELSARGSAIPGTRSLSWLLAFLLLAVGAQAAAYERQRVEGKPNAFLFWQNRNLTYYLNRNGSADVSLQETLGAVKRASFSWAAPSCTDISFRFGGLESGDQTNLTLKQGESPDKRNLLVWHEDRWPPPGATDQTITDKMPAVTTVIYDATTGVIFDADVDFNGYNFFWTTFDDQAKVATDIESTVAHELGHVLGLAHSPNPEATMFGTTSQGELKKRSLEQDDAAGICFIYPFDLATPQGSGQGTEKVDVQGGCALGGPAGRPLEALLPLVVLLLARRRGPRPELARRVGTSRRWLKRSCRKGIGKRVD